jgi:beta-lactamase class A
VPAALTTASAEPDRRQKGCGILARMKQTTPISTRCDYQRRTLIPLILLLVSLLLPASSYAEITAQIDLKPIQDPQLQAKLNQLVDEQGWGPQINNRSMAIALVLLEEESYRLAMLNGEHMVYAASLPKIAILFAAMVASQEGDLQIDAALEEDLHDMIRVSCNPCATRVMEQVGREQLLQVLQRPEYGFYNEDLYGGLWVGKDYGASPAHKRDPIRGLSHGASAYQVARIYYHLYRGTLLDAKHTAMMRDILSRPGIEHKFVRGLANEEGLELWRKSGSWKDFHADSVLVQWSGKEYILVGLIEGANGDRQLEQLAQAAHKLVNSL